MDGDPREGGEDVSTDGVRVEVKGVDFKVEPVEGEGLDEAQDGFSKKGVDAVVGAVLEEQSEDTVAEDESGEGVGALSLVLDVEGGPEVKVFGEAAG